MQAKIRSSLEATRAVIDLALKDEALLAAVEKAGLACAEALKGGHKLLLCGNGGSAADCQHIAAELVGRLNYDRPGLPAIALTTDTSALTAIGNDYGFERVFSRQVEALGQKGDALLAISTSGNSANVLAGLKAARERGLMTFGLSGRTGGKMAALCDIILKIPSDKTPHVQECHLAVGHALCEVIEDTLYGREYGGQRS